MGTSTIAAAVTGLVAMVDVAMPAPPSGAVVIDGPPVPGSEPAEYVAIGVAHHATTFAREEQYAVVGGQSPAGLGNQRRQETYDIYCRVSCTAGDTDMAVTRARAFDLLAYVETAVRSDGTLDGTVIFGEVGGIALSQVQSGTAAVAVIDFAVDVKITRI